MSPLSYPHYIISSLSAPLLPIRTMVATQNMPLAARSIPLPIGMGHVRHEYFSKTYSLRVFSLDGRYATSSSRSQERRGFQLCSWVALQISSYCRKPKHFQVLRSCTQNYSFAHTKHNPRNDMPLVPEMCQGKRVLRVMKQSMHSGLVEVAATVLCIMIMVVPSANAADALKTCTCLLKECRIEFAKCITNPSCAANVACLQTCNNRPDETECQIKCGDLFENSVVDEFNECAVSRKKCVPRKSDVGEFPVPSPAALVPSFDIADFNGKWFITAGLNPSFDTFDCQLHNFHLESNKLVGNLSWRIRTPDGGFLTRSAVQKFVQDPTQKGILYNHDNEYLHYQDDWYILSSKIENKEDDYVFVYYRGRNDAWDGYGGAVVYTRSAVLPESIVPELDRAARSVGRDFNTFSRTDNTCGPEPSIAERLEKTVVEGEKAIVREVEEIEGQVEKVGKTEMTLFQRLGEGFKVLREDEENFLRELSEEEMEILNELKLEASQVEKLFGNSIPLRKLR